MKLRTSFGVVATASLVLAGTALQGTAIADDGGGLTNTVRIEDRCEPTSFNAAIGEGTCVPNEHGDVTFEEFLEELNPTDFGDDHWRFSRENFSVDKGERVALTNPGGEAHTFTEVAAFGGGCLDQLNVPLGLTGLDGPACGAALKHAWYCCTNCRGSSACVRFVSVAPSNSQHSLPRTSRRVCAASPINE